MNMKLHRWVNVLLSIILFSAVSVSCTPASSKPIPLASFTENYVDVSISLEHNSEGVVSLSATFTPSDGHHLYSKDIPIAGINGLGRPTLIELPKDSHMKAIGGLTESVSAEASGYGPGELLVYPAGPVTLSLPVQLPPGNGWIDDAVKITYMACSAYQCKPPVEGKIVPVRIPGVDVR
jgi:hypothetical protein